MTINDIKRAVENELRVTFAELGFERHKRSFFKEVRPSVLGTIQIASRAIGKTGTVAFAPTVGVRFQQIERIVSELKKEKYDEYGSGTFGQSLGYLMPKRTYVEWEVRSVSEAGDSAASVTSAVKEFGLPFIESHKSLRQAMDFMVPFAHGNLVFAWAPIVGFAMLGERNKAIDLLDYWLEQKKNDKPWATKELRMFARNFHDMKDSIPVKNP